MAWFRKLVFAGLVACAVPVQLAQAQTNANLPSSLPSGQNASSDDAIQSGSALQSGQVAGRKNTLKSSGSSSARSKVVSGSVPGEARGLCFQPGIGWRRLPQASFNSDQHTSATGNSATAEASGSAVGGESGSVNRLPFGEDQTKLDQCPGIMTSATPGAAIETMAADRQSKVANSDMRTTSANAGAQDWLQADTLLNPASSTASTQLTMGLTSSLSSSKHSSHGISGSSTSSVQGLETQAYLSPIKLRRMMRNAPDLETRLKLRELSEQEKKKPSKSAGSGSEHKGHLEDQKNRYGMSNYTHHASRDNKTHEYP